MDELGLGGVGGDGGNGLHAGVAHDDAVALDVAEAGGVAHHHGAENLVAVVLGHGAGDDPALGVVAVELNLHVALGQLPAVGQQALGDHHLAARLADELGGAVGGVDAPDLDGVHLHGAALAQVDHGFGVHDIGAGLAGVVLAVVLFGVADAAVFADVEGVDAVVAALVAAGVMDAAAGHDLHVAVVAYVKIVIHQLAVAGLADDDGDMARLAPGAGEDADDDALAARLRLRLDLDMLRGLAHLAAAVLADVDGAYGLSCQVGNLLQKVPVDFGNHKVTSFLSMTGQPPRVSARIMGNTSSVVPRWAICPPATTAISSARRMMRSWWEMIIIVDAWRA